MPKLFGIPLATFVFAFAMASCHRTAPPHPIPQRGYLWQRDWTPPVAAAFAEASAKMDGVIVLGGEIGWNGGSPQVIRANVPWNLLREGRPVSIGLRVAPYPGPFAPDDAAARAIVETACSLLSEAAAHGVKVSELQLDFDCAQAKLAGYRLWVEAVRRAISPTRLFITALPSWLDEKEFPALVRAADGYVLQVHSVPTQKESGRASLCDTALARKWVAKASRLGLPFSVALPTYRCLAGYGPDGRLLGVIMDSVAPHGRPAPGCSISRRMPTRSPRWFANGRRLRQRACES